jgi:hypothetical protein
MPVILATQEDQHSKPAREILNRKHPITKKRAGEVAEVVKVPN